MRNGRPFPWPTPILLALLAVACGGGSSEPDDPCTPNPCTQIPPPACVDNAVTTYRPICSNNAGEPDCAYEVDRSQDCGTARCDPDTVTCVACLQDSDCPVQGMTCRDHVCTQPCAADAREINDSAAQATPLQGDEDWPGLTLCDGDQDWFSIGLTATAQLTAHIAFGQALGDLDLTLIGPDGATQVAAAGAAADGEELVHTIDANGVYYVRVDAAAGVSNNYRLGIAVTGGTDPCMPNPCTAVPPPGCVGELLLTYQGTCTEVGGAAQCDYSVAQSLDCAAQGQHCDPDHALCVACLFDAHCAAGEICVAGFCLDDPCLPDPCSQVPQPTCTGDVLETYRGACDVVGGNAVCSYPVDQTIDCAAQDERCDPLAPACVACLLDTDCPWPFEICQARACVAGCQDDLREPNDTSATASVITADIDLAGLLLCAFDQDWYAVDLGVGTILTASVSHDPAQGDLELYLMAPDGMTPLAAANGPAVPAALGYTVQVGGAGTHFLLVQGAAADQAVYELITTSGMDPCIPSPCTLVPDSYCTGQTLTTYVGVCTVEDGLPTCSYPVDQVVDCSAQGQYCDAADPACVDCFSDAECPWPFEVCQARACVAGCRDDDSEPNDSAAQPTSIPADSLLTGRVLCSGNEDWWQLALQEGDRLVAQLGFTHADGNLDLELRGPDGVTVVAGAYGTTDDELIDLTLPPGASGSYHLRVFGVGGAHNVYSLLTARTDDPCLPSPCTAVPPPQCAGETLWVYSAQCLPDGGGGATCSYPGQSTDCLLAGLRCNPASPACVDCLTTADCAWPFEVCQALSCVGGCQDDGFEVNDAAAQATPLAAGQLYPDLVLCAGDADWYAIALQPQQTLRGRIDFTHAAGDLSLQIVGPDGSTVLATSAGATNSEEAAATNTTASAATYFLRAYGVGAAQNVYQASSTVLPDPCSPNPCTAVPPAICVGNVLTTYQGVCTNNLGVASCSYPVATQQDCTTSGGLCQSATCVGRFAVTGDIVITEIMYDPDMVLDRYGEYVEVMCIAADMVNLRGLTFSDLAANSYSIGVDLFVAPGDFAVLGVSANLNQNGGTPVDWAWGGNQGILNNDTTGETVYLRRGGTLVDSASYCDVGAGCFSSVPGASLQLDLDHADPASNDNSAYWCRTPAGTTFGDGDRGTPGAGNTDCGVLAQEPI